ncbi:hypothetical protein GLI01_23140 [Gluconacetobacter liquefaciens]|nr:hypothetical protein AA0522_0827 [Gluconacetobacter liquefaciens NRIC 0522]GEB38279.1 hypothetical protein GLI01_23140 [Gluconacetobacter liquefaciens]
MQAPPNRADGDKARLIAAAATHDLRCIPFERTNEREIDAMLFYIAEAFRFVPFVSHV